MHLDSMYNNTGSSLVHVNQFEEEIIVAAFEIADISSKK